MPDPAWPTWWSWQLELTAHLLKRMADRDFSEVDLRLMLQEAHGFRPDIEPSRWIVEIRHHGQPWEVIVEPDEQAELLVVVTAYAIG